MLNLLNAFCTLGLACSGHGSMSRCFAMLAILPCCVLGLGLQKCSSMGCMPVFVSILAIELALATDLNVFVEW